MVILNLRTHSNQMKTFKFLALLAAAVLPVNLLLADPVFVSNFSFESPTGSSPNGLFDPANGSIGDWQYQRSSLLLPATSVDVTFGSWGAATDGSNAAQLTFLTGVLGTVSIFQDLGTTFLANSIYTLSFDADQYSAVALLSGASAALYAGATPVASLSGSSLLGILDGTGAMHSFTLQYTTGESVPAGNIGVGFSAGGVAELLGSGIVIDNVRLDVTPVPEPGGVLLLGLGVSQLLLTRRRPFRRR